MSRVSRQRLLVIAEGMSPADRELAETVERLKLASHWQLARLLPSSVEASPVSTARIARRTLARLSELGVLARLERRIGGVRAGSAGYVFYVGPVGQRLLGYWSGDGLVRGRVQSEPGARFVHHRLAVSELYVVAREQERAGGLDLLAFDVEPDCWRSSLDGFGGSTTLKPDAFVRLGIGAYEDRWFVEVDLGTESRTVLRRKLRAYLDYFHTGTEQAEHGVFPRVLWLTATEARKAVLIDICAALPAEYWPLFAVTTLERGIEVMAGNTAEMAHQMAPGDPS